MIANIAAFAGGFFVGQLTGSILSRWAVALYKSAKDYRASVTHPDSGHRRSMWMFLPLLLLHSGPYFLALLVFGAFKLLTSAPQPWHAWLIGGFVANLALMTALVGWALNRQKARKRNRA